MKKSILDDSFYTKPFVIFFKSSIVLDLFDKVVMTAPSQVLNKKFTGTITWKTLNEREGFYRYRATFNE